MLLTTHALAGAVIGKNIDNLWFIAGISLATHFIMDCFRHGEYLDENATWKDFWRVGVDLSIGTTAVIFSIYSLKLSPETVRNMMVGIFFSLLPDGLTLLQWKFGANFLEPVTKFHSKFHHLPKESGAYEWTLRNFSNDALFSLLALTLLFFF